MEHQPSNQMACITPFGVRDKKTGETINVPCGRCPECTKRRISAWSFRLMQEEQRSYSAHFITLTYDTLHVTLTRAGFMSLNKRDVQLFFKRLRKADPKQSIKYYIVGEYGGKTKRPHYHAIIFNLSSPQLADQCWQLGAVHFGTVTGASIGYTLEYISKGRIIPEHRNDDREPEFSLMSKGLGSGYITDETKHWHLTDMHNRMHLTVAGGKKVSMPRYYKDKIYNDGQRKAIQLHQVPLIEQREALARSKHWNYDHNKVQLHHSQFKQQKLKSSKRDKQ